MGINIKPKDEILILQILKIFQETFFFQKIALIFVIIIIMLIVFNQEHFSLSIASFITIHAFFQGRQWKKNTHNLGLSFEFSPPISFSLLSNNLTSDLSTDVFFFKCLHRCR